MHGLVFVTFENFLRQTFGLELLMQVRTYKKDHNAPPIFLENQIYPDELLFGLLTYVCELVDMSPDDALRAYGKYYITNELTGHLCAYLLQRVSTAQELLLTMSKAHEQMQKASQDVTPPLFYYQSIGQNGLLLKYESHRHLCSLLYGAIEGAAERYSERVNIQEVACMKRGASACQFHVQFSSLPASSTLQQGGQSEAPYQQALADFILAALPDREAQSLMLHQLPMLLSSRYGFQIEQYARPIAVYQAIRQLEHAGQVSATAAMSVEERRYWRAPDAKVHYHDPRQTPIEVLAERTPTQPLSKRSVSSKI
ncbi:MAG: heme NO-binding domain-containing protein [Ktedonobacteraceae bacterium]|nr:heme NO-binding domain-containing protein [Ktedonobacteraceae bacterium]